MLRHQKPTWATNLKTVLTCICSLVMLQGYGQTASEDFSKLEPLFLERKLDEGLPYFERIFSGNDTEVKMQTAIFVQEKSLEDLWINLDKQWVNYLKILGKFLSEIHLKKELDARDIYYDGLFHYIVGHNGANTKEMYERAVSAFHEAQMRGYPGALHYLAKAASQLQKYDPGITDEQIFEVTLAADQQTQEPKLLYDIVRENMLQAFQHPHVDVMPEERRNPEDIERALTLFTHGMDLIQQHFADSFPTTVSDLWSGDVFNPLASASGTSFVREPEANVLITYFKKTPLSSSSGVIKAYTYNYLFQLLGGLLPEEMEEAYDIWIQIVSDIKELNRNDREKIEKTINDFEATVSKSKNQALTSLFKFRNTPIQAEYKSILKNGKDTEISVESSYLQAKNALLKP